jgi:hypothetical protein
MKTQSMPQASNAKPGEQTNADKKNPKDLDGVLLLIRHDMKVELLSAAVALVVGIVIFEIAFITVLSNLTGWTLVWVGIPGLIISLLLLFVVYVLVKHKANVEKLTELVQNLNTKK